MYSSTKTYGHNLGLSVAFRQWRAKSHCQFIHGYALEVRLEFEAHELDENNWVVDFGALKSFKGWLEATFDHKLLYAADDPMKEQFLNLARKGLAEVIEVKATGCEAFARMIYNQADDWLDAYGYKPRVRVASVEVREHGANSAIYRGDE